MAKNKKNKEASTLSLTEDGEIITGFNNFLFYYYYLFFLKNYVSEGKWEGETLFPLR